MENLNEQLSRIKNLIGYTHELNSNMVFEQVTDPTQNPIYPVFYSKLGDKSKRYWDGTEKGVPQMTPDDKNKILDQVKLRVDKSVKALQSQGKNIDFEKRLSQAERIVIMYKQGQTVQQQQTETVTINIPYKAQYPDATTNNPELQQFYYQENQTVVPEDKVAKFDIMIQELKNQIPANEKVVEIHIKAGSTTSQVPTTYGMSPGTRYKTIEEGQQNNIKLAQDRCATIETTLKTIIEKYFPTNLNYKLVIDERQAKPNNGPAYTTKEQKYFFGTGKLDPAKKPEYDKLYGPYKGSYGSVMIITQGTTTETITPADVIQVNEWSVRVEFPYKGTSTKKPKKYRSKGGGIIDVGGGLNTTGCPIW